MSRDASRASAVSTPFSQRSEGGNVVVDVVVVPLCDVVVSVEVVVLVDVVGRPPAKAAGTPISSRNDAAIPRRYGTRRRMVGRV